MRIITFQEFLKKYSTISNRFIDEYYTLLLNDNICVPSDLYILSKLVEFVVFIDCKFNTLL